MKVRSGSVGKSTVVLALATNLLALGSHAQDVAPSESLEEVTVTGSRIARDGTNSPTPLTTVSADQIRLSAPNTLAEALNQLPVFKGSNQSRATVSSANTPGGGGNLLSLRGLTAPRTLVLLDGLRIVPTTSGGTTDINSIPMGLVRSVDVVTGGASAAYGSDAVAGVVNFILDTSFRGIKTELSLGESTHGDFDSQKASVVVGTSFAGERGRVVASLDYFRLENPGAGFRRDWETKQDSWIANPVAGARPARIRATGVVNSGATTGGLITSGPLRGTAFGPGGVPYAHDYGQLAGSVNQIGGTGQAENRGIGSEIHPQLSFFSHGEFDFSDSATGFVNVMLAQSKARTKQYHTWHFLGSTQPIIQIDNAFLPASIRTQMIDAGVTTFPLGRIDADAGPLYFDTDMQMKRVALGVRGELGAWKYRFAYTHGESDTKTDNPNNIIEHNYFAAIDSVVHPDTGEIVCRSTLEGYDPGCVPFNPFGQGSPSAAANAWVRGNSLRDLNYKQDFISIDVQRDLFSLWSGPSTLALVAEYRDESAKQKADEISASTISFPGIRGAPAAMVGKQGGFSIGNPLPFEGEFDVKELAAEFNVPILSGARGVETLEFNGAARYTDYSTSGSVETWKAGLVYAPFDQLRLRATRSRDIRAANMAELFATGVGNAGGNVINPLTGSQVILQGLLQAGNPDLTPEKADTLTAGLVYQPSWLPGFYLSADYYDIQIEDAIALLNGQVALNQCLLQNNATACSVFQDITPTAIFWTQKNLNIASLETSGVDIELGYNTPLAGGRLSLRMMATYLDEFVQTTPGAAPIDTAGQYNLPHWQGVLNVGYDIDRLSLFLQQRYLGGGLYNSTWREGIDISDNSVPATWYTDLTAKYRIPFGSRDYEAFLTVQNLFDKDPEWTPFNLATITSHTDPSVYDVVGRYFIAGVRFQF